MPKAKQAAQPPPRDDPAQSERFIKDATAFASDDGAQLFERAMKTVVRPAKLPEIAVTPIIKRPKVSKKNTGKK